MLKLTTNKLTKINNEVAKVIATIPTAHNRKLEKVKFSETNSRLAKLPKMNLKLDINKTYNLLIRSSYNAGTSKFNDTIYYFKTEKFKIVNETNQYYRTDKGLVNKEKVIAIISR